VAKENNVFELEVKSEEEIAKIVADIVASNGKVFQVLTEQLSLEEVYFNLTNRQGGNENGQ